MQLQRLIRAPSTPQSLATSCRIGLTAIEGEPSQQIASSLGILPITVSKWRRAFASGGMEGLQDAPRSGPPIRHGREIREKVQNRFCQQPEFPSRWSVRTLARQLALKYVFWRRINSVEIRNMKCEEPLDF